MLLALISAAVAPLPARGQTERSDREAIRERIERLRAIADYDRTATFLEGYADRFPSDADAREAILEAVELRLGLGQYDQASRDVERFAKLFGRTRPLELDALLFMLAEDHLAHERWEQAHEVASGLLARRAAQLDAPDRLIARGIAAESLARLGRAPEAAKAFAIIDAQSQAEAFAATKAGRSLRRLGRALEVVGQARYLAAVDAKHKSSLASVPRLAPTRDRTAVRRFMVDRVRPWLERTHKSLEAAERAYRRVLEIRPLPPPRWTIAATADVGSMWAELADTIEHPPWPDPVPREALAAYREVIEQLSAPLRHRAKGALETCLQYGARFQVANDDTRRCEEWLTRHYPQEYPRLDEIVPGWLVPDDAVVPQPLPREEPLGPEPSNGEELLEPSPRAGPERTGGGR